MVVSRLGGAMRLVQQCLCFGNQHQGLFLLNRLSLKGVALVDTSSGEPVKVLAKRLVVIFQLLHIRRLSDDADAPARRAPLKSSYRAISHSTCNGCESGLATRITMGHQKVRQAVYACQPQGRAAHTPECAAPDGFRFTYAYEESRT